MEKTFKITWDDELGRDWMNIFNLELCLFSKQCIGPNAKPLVEAEEVFPEKVNPSESK